MQWAAWRYAGSFRIDSAIDPDSGNFLSVKTVTEDDNYWFVTLKELGLINPLLSPFSFQFWSTRWIRASNNWFLKTE